MPTPERTTLFLLPQLPDVENLRALLAETCTERDRLRMAWHNSQRKVTRLRKALRQATGDRRRHALEEAAHVST